MRPAGQGDLAELYRKTRQLVWCMVQMQQTMAEWQRMGMIARMPSLSTLLRYQSSRSV